MLYICITKKEVIIIDKKITDMKATVTNPYYLAYLNHIKKIKEKETNHGFMIWIQKKHADFRKTGISKHDRNYHDAFLKWLNQ